MTEALATRSLSTAMGVEISGVDLCKPLAEGVQQQMRSLLDRHALLLFRDQVLEPEDQRRVLSVFGPIGDERGDGKGYSYVSNVRPDGILGDTPLPFHADYDFRPYIPPVFSLYGFEIEGVSIPTIYVSLANAYRLLPPAFKARIADLKIVNADDFSRGLASPDYAKRYSLLKFEVPPPETTHPRAVHPLVKPHPRTGEPLLFASEMHSSHIEGMDADSSEALIQEIFSVIYSEENRFVHHWRKGDLIIWDNVAAQHGRRFDKEAATRTRRSLCRVIVSELTAAQLLGPGYNRPGSFEVAKSPNA